VMSGGENSRLQPIRSDNASRPGFFNDQVIADFVKAILVQSAQVSAVESLVELEIKDLEPQTLSGFEIRGGRCETRAIGPDRRGTGARQGIGGSHA
jgi:hypothetical protein